jgi:class 3 adenylate cyclase
LVREMCVGKQYAFTKKGDYELKGFSEPVPIYLLDWQSDADAPDGDAPNGDAPAD